MAASFKPDGYSTVSPYLIATGAQKVIDFLKQAFGARELRRYDMPDGSIMHAEVRIGDTVVMVGDAGDNWPAVPQANRRGAHRRLDQRRDDLCAGGLRKRA